MLQTKNHSTWPPLSFTMALSLFDTAAQLTRTVSSGMAAHAASMWAIRSSLLYLGFSLAFVSTMPYMAKSKELTSGDDGGCIVLSQKCSKWLWHQDWTRRAVWAGAPSCVTTHKHSRELLLDPLEHLVLHELQMDVLVDLNTVRDPEAGRFLPLASHCSQHRNRGRPLGPVRRHFAGSGNGGSLFGQNPVILVVEGTCDGEQLLIGVDDHHVRVITEQCQVWQDTWDSLTNLLMQHAGFRDTLLLTA